MTKQEFLNRLRTSLNGKISADLVTENLRYYEDYINTQIRMGKSEQEVMNNLGDPQLIAKTIVESNKAATQSGDNSAYSNSQSEGYADNGYNGQPYAYNGNKVKGVRVSPWVVLLVVILIILLIISLLISIVSFFAPVIIVLVLIYFGAKMIREWFH